MTSEDKINSFFYFLFCSGMGSSEEEDWDLEDSSGAVPPNKKEGEDKEGGAREDRASWPITQSDIALFSHLRHQS